MPNPLQGPTSVHTPKALFYFLLFPVPSSVLAQVHRGFGRELTMLHIRISLRSKWVDSEKVGVEVGNLTVEKVTEAVTEKGIIERGVGVLAVGNSSLETAVGVVAQFSVTALHSLCVGIDMETRIVLGDVTNRQGLEEIMTHVRWWLKWWSLRSNLDMEANEGRKNLREREKVLKMITAVSLGTPKALRTKW